ncbi:hypothetical protein [Litchfieldia alkalitelluris]|nr:hypothetical protein [Litchfieldia alkalitelluris]
MRKKMLGGIFNHFYVIEIQATAIGIIYVGTWLDLLDVYLTVVFK